MEEVSQIGQHLNYFIPEASKGISDEIHRTKLKKMKKTDILKRANRK